MSRGELFFCTDCGHESRKWLGRCPGCGAWNTFSARPAPDRKRGGSVEARGAAPVPVAEAVSEQEHRVSTGLARFDRVLGGGLVEGSLLLVAGEPGIGKSTLLLQVAGAMAGSDAPVVYVTAEESARQVALRARRLGIASEGLLLLSEVSCEAVLGHLEPLDPALVVVDSVQTMVAEGMDALAGSPSQVRQVAARFQQFAKTRGVPVVLVGHVTKDGSIAGPKLLEHLVDVVLSMEGETGHELRVLRAAKNRYGTVSELALFSMTGTGLEEVANPSAWLLEDRQAGAPGSAVAVALEGTAPLLVEVQALVTPSSLANPRRVAHGLDGSRLALLLAILERRTPLAFGDRDVFLNVVGGLSLREPGLDLAVAAAVLSSLLDRPLPRDAVVLGEVGLLGEVRAVSRSADRVREAAALGFARVVLPARDATGDLALAPVPLGRVEELLDLLGGAPR